MKLSEQIEQHLAKIAESFIPVIVEGKNDKKALKQFDIDDIFTLSTPIYKVIEKLKHKEVIILTDFDKKGKELYRKINHECSQRGIKVNNTLRVFLLKKTPLSHIEGLPTYLKNLKVKEHNPYIRTKNQSSHV